MPELNKDRIFNESSKKVLIREFENLKKDYTKMNALKYKTLYEDASLSFILENSRYIFSEPMRGIGFYKSIMETATIPFQCMEEECDKVSTYLYENKDNMSNTQIELYEDLVSLMEKKYSSMKNSIRLYNAMMENTDDVIKYYDYLYEFKTNKNVNLDNIKHIMTENKNYNLMDSINIISEVPELYSTLYKYVEAAYVEESSTPNDYSLNSFSTNVISRMMKDSYISEKVENISNINLRHLIQGLSCVENSDYIESIKTEFVKNYDPVYSSPINSINRVFEDDIYSDIMEDVNNEEKLNRLLCEKAVIDMNLAFVLLDHSTADYGDLSYKNSVIEKMCIESSEIEKIPQTIEEQIDFLTEASENIEKQIRCITEKYFTADGSPSKIVSASVGLNGADSSLKKSNEKDKKEDIDKETEKVYSPVIDTDDEDDEKEEEKKKLAKAKKTEKYSKMDLDDEEFKSISEKEDGSYEEIEKPHKRNIFQRVQNKALDTNVKFKKKVAEGKRNAVDAKNAGKAVAKIPMNITDSIKKTINDWDEIDDNRRKEYIIKPGFRKKYFKALKLCILHYGAFAINPVLNIVLAICHKFSNTKDIRIRNELVRELKAEIKVTDEKIEDAKSSGDNQAKYKLMRIKEKLEAELVRVGANSKFI